MRGTRGLFKRTPGPGPLAKLKDVGFPMRRTRFLAAAVNRDTVVWTGPASPDLLAKEFLGTFGQAPMMEADDFLNLDTEEQHNVLLSEIAANRGLFCPPSVLRSIPLDQLLCPSKQRHVANYRAIFGTTHKVGARGSFVVDLSQNPEERPRCGAWFPTLTCNSNLYSMSGKDFFTNAELDFAMGFPSISLPQVQQYACVVPEALQIHRRDRATYAKLIGNGMHVGSLFAWFGYVFAHCVRRYDIERVILALPLSFDETQEVEDDF